MLHRGPFELVGPGRSQPPTTHAPRGFNNPFRGSPPHSDYQSEGILGRIHEPPWGRCPHGAVDARQVDAVVVVVVVVVC